MTSPTDQTARPLCRDFSASAQRTLGELRQLFPRAFATVRPLKVGITEDIVARTSISSDQVCEFMRFYCNASAYLRATLRSGAVRYALDGRPVGAVSIAERMHSTLRLEEQAADRRKSKQFLAFHAAVLDPIALSQGEES